MFDLFKWGKGKRFLGLKEREEAKRQRAMDLLTRPKGDALRPQPAKQKVAKVKPHFQLVNGRLRVPNSNVWDLILERKERMYHSPFQCGRAFGAYLEKRGFERVGSGAYSIIYGKPGSDRVIKVNKQLDPWFEYVKWAYESGHKDYAPKVYSYKYFPGKTKKDCQLPDAKPKEEDLGSPFYVAVVDRLRPEYNVPNVENKHALTGYLFHYATRKELHPDLEAAAELISPGIVKFSKDFKERFKKYSLDCYGANTMLTGDLQRWILNDPLCGKPQNDNDIKVRYKQAS